MSKRERGRGRERERKKKRKKKRKSELILFQTIQFSINTQLTSI